MSVAVAIIDDVGLANNVTALSVTDSATASHSLTAGKRAVSYMITGSSICWYGGSDVNPATNLGHVLSVRFLLMFRQVSSDHILYFKCASGASTTVSIIEYD